MELSPDVENPIHQLLDAPYEMDLPIKNLKKDPDYDLITGKVLKELPLEGIQMLRIIFNAILRLRYFLEKWKVAQVLMIQKPDKDLTEAPASRSINLLPIIWKVPKNSSWIGLNRFFSQNHHK